MSRMEGSVAGAICGGRQILMATAYDCRPDRYCFRCRKRLRHTWEMWGDPPEVESYYEPLPSLRCTGCAGDYTLGFGWEYDGPHYPEEPLTWIKEDADA